MTEGDIRRIVRDVPGGEPGMEYRERNGEGMLVYRIMEKTENGCLLQLCGYRDGRGLRNSMRLTGKW